MNSKKYKDTLYKMRYINDLRDMIVSSAELYADDPAFMVKDTPVSYTHLDVYKRQGQITYECRIRYRQC